MKKFRVTLSFSRYLLRATMSETRRNQSSDEQIEKSGRLQLLSRFMTPQNLKLYH